MGPEFRGIQYRMTLAGDQKFIKDSLVGYHIAYMTLEGVERLSHMKVALSGMEARNDSGTVPLCHISRVITVI